jgi:hypothetical protein
VGKKNDQFDQIGQVRASMKPARNLLRCKQSIGLSGAFFVVCVFAAACASSSSAEPPSSGGDANAAGSSPTADASSDQGQGGAPFEEASDSWSSEADQTASNGDAAEAAVGDAHRDAAIFTGVAKIMVLGSSNESITCWRAFLWQKLRDAKITNFDFVGSQTVGPDCGVAGYDKDCEARSGTIITSIPAATYHDWFAAHPPDIVLMHIGGADLLSNIPVADVIKAYSVIVEQARTVNPKVVFLVAEHTPQDPAGCTNCLTDVMALNSAIPGWAMQMTTAASPVSAVDLFTGLDLTTDFSDRVHLNVAGSEKVSDRWLAALLPLFQP